MTKTVTRTYAQLRAKGWRAAHALDAAKTRAAWDKAETQGLVRLQVLPDETSDMENLKGDTFNPKANPDIPRARMEREEKAFEQQVERDGVWGVVGEYYDGETWQHADSCWGFVGDEWQDSGYDDDIKSQTLEALTKLKHCPTCGRPKLHKGGH